MQLRQLPKTRSMVLLFDSTETIGKLLRCSMTRSHSTKIGNAVPSGKCSNS